jgi:hypothetical protein
MSLDFDMSGQLSARVREIGYTFDMPCWRAGLIRINLTQLSDGSQNDGCKETKPHAFDRAAHHC